MIHFCQYLYKMNNVSKNRKNNKINLSLPIKIVF